MEEQPYIPDKERSMTRPPKEQVNFMILQQFQNILNAYRAWEVNYAKDNYDRGLIALTSEVKAMILLIRSSLIDRIKKEKELSTYQSIEQMRDILLHPTPTEIYTMIDYLEGFLYTKSVTKWDTKEKHDRTDIIGMNEEALGNDY